MDFSSAAFNLNEYVEKDLEQLIGKTTGATISSLEALKEQLAARQEQLEEAGASPPLGGAGPALPQFDQDAYQLKPLLAKHEELLRRLRERRDAMYEEVKYVRGVKAAVDRIVREKEQILAGIFILDFVRDLKLGNDVYALRLDSLPRKVQFARVAKEIENHVSIYEKASLAAFAQVKKAVLGDFAEQLRAELREERYEHTADILRFLAQEKLREAGFEAVFEKFVYASDLAAFPTAFDRKYVEDIRSIFLNFLAAAAAFFESRQYLRSGFFLLIDEKYLQRFCAYALETKFALLFERILGANLRHNPQFFLSYLESVHLLLQELRPNFEAVRAFSLDLYEHIAAKRALVIEPYHAEYFPVEQKFFGFAVATFGNYAANKLKTAGADELRKLLGLSLPEHIAGVGAMLSRCALLSGVTFSHANVSSLLLQALREFQGLCGLLAEGVAQAVPPFATDAQLPVPLTVFEHAAQIHAAFLLANLRVRAVMPQLAASNYFSECESARKLAFDRIQALVADLLSKAVDGVLRRASLVADALLQKAKEAFGVLAVVKGYVEGYVGELRRLGNAEVRAAAEELFYRNLIVLIEGLLLADRARRKRLDFGSELVVFFELFGDVRSPALEGDVAALKSLLLTLKENKRNVGEFIGPGERQYVSKEKLEKYNRLLA